MVDDAARETEQKVDMLAGRDRLGGPARAHAVVYLDDRSIFVDLGEGREVVLGRSEEAGVQLPTPTVSRRHFLLRWADGQLSVQDAGSTNGTFVNGQRVRGEVILKGGDEIVAGDALVVMGVTSPSPFVQHISPSEAFDARLGHEVLRASRLGRMLALLRVHFGGPAEEAARGLAVLLSALPGRPVARALGPSDYHVLVDEAVESVRGVCERLATGPAIGSEGGGAFRFGLALLRDGQDMATLVRRADASLSPGAAPIAAARREGPIALDPASVKVFALVDRVAASDGTVLLVGETGVGKEVVAQEIHRRSARCRGPFVAVNCGAIPSTMFSREMFGHERGSFTGASERRVGFFEAASGGTLFLDEVGEIPLGDQVQLLRALESRTVTRLGGTKPSPVDIRILAATNRDLRQMVSQGRFRQDLLYRLDVLTIVIPALRDRRRDIAAFADRFLAEASETSGRPGLAFGPKGLSTLERHGWPGNVRELRNVVERLALLCQDSVIEDAEVLDVLYGDALPRVDLAGDADLSTLLEEVERAAIGRALAACGGNQTLAAERLGISRRTLIYRMQRYEMPGPRSRRG